jgi:hypothetical protein
MSEILKKKNVDNKPKEVLDKVKLWLEDEIEANEQFGDDPTNTAEDLLTKIKEWEKAK